MVDTRLRVYNLGLRKEEGLETTLDLQNFSCFASCSRRKVTLSTVTLV